MILWRSGGKGWLRSGCWFGRIEYIWCPRGHCTSWSPSSRRCSSWGSTSTYTRGKSAGTWCPTSPCSPTQRKVPALNPTGRGKARKATCPSSSSKICSYASLTRYISQISIKQSGYPSFFLFICTEHSCTSWEVGWKLNETCDIDNPKSCRSNCNLERKPASMHGCGSL